MTNLAVTAQPRYDYVAAMLRKAQPAPAKVVELGAAPGDQIAQLARMGYDCVAVDIGLAADEWAHASAGRMVRLLEDAGVSLVSWDLEQVPYPLGDESFDAVVMTEVYEHLRDYPIRALEEVHRILRPGGYLYFTTPNAAYLRSRLTLLRGKSPATPLRDWIGGVPHARHAREYTFGEVHELLDRVGLTVVVSESHHFYRAEGGIPGRLCKSGIERLARLRPTLGPSILIVAMKPKV